MSPRRQFADRLDEIGVGTVAGTLRGTEHRMLGIVKHVARIAVLHHLEMRRDGSFEREPP